MLLVPAALLLTWLLNALTPRLLLVRSTLLLRGPLTPAALLRRNRLLSPTALLGRLTVRRLALRRLTRNGPVLLRRLLRTLTPTATTLTGRLLSPATLLGRLRRLSARSPVLPAWLTPRLPRTPRSLRRRRHICSF